MSSFLTRAASASTSTSVHHSSINICLSCVQLPRPGLQLLQLQCHHLICIDCVRNRRILNCHSDENDVQNEPKLIQSQSSAGLSQFYQTHVTDVLAAVQNNAETSLNVCSDLKNGLEMQVCTPEDIRKTKEKKLDIFSDIQNNIKTDVAIKEKLNMQIDFTALNSNKKNHLIKWINDTNGHLSINTQHHEHPLDGLSLINEENTEGSENGKLTQSDGNYEIPLIKQILDKTRFSQRKRKNFNSNNIPLTEKENLSNTSPINSIETQKHQPRGVVLAEVYKPSYYSTNGSVAGDQTNCYKQPMLPSPLGLNSHLLDDLEEQIICPVCSQVSSSMQDMLRTPKLSVGGLILQQCNICDLKQRDAEYYCKRCVLNLCSICVQLHEKMPLLKSHVILHLSSRDSLSQYCEEHPTRVVEYLCYDCDIICCSICLLKVHKDHEVNHLKDALSAIKEQIKSQLNDLSPKIDSLEDLLSQLNGGSVSRKISVMSVDGMRFESPAVPRQRHCYSVSSRSSCMEQHSLVSRQLSEQSRGNGGFEEAGAFEQIVRNVRQLLLYTTRIIDLQQSKKLLQLRHCLLLRLVKCNESECLRVRQLLESHLRSLKCGSLGNLSLNELRMDVNSTTAKMVSNMSEASLKSSASQIFAFNEIKGSSRPRLLWKIERSKSGEGVEMGSPVAVAFLRSPPRPGHPLLVVAEFDAACASSNRLRIVDTNQGHILASLNVGDIQPLGVAMTRDGRSLVVSDGKGKRLRLMTVDGQMQGEMGKGQLGWPHGVACNSVGQIVVSDVFGDCVNIYSPDGKKLKSFGKSGIGNNRFRNPYHVTIDSKDNIYVSDSGNDIVKVYDSGGRFINSCPSNASKRSTTSQLSPVSPQTCASQAPTTTDPLTASNKLALQNENLPFRLFSNEMRVAEVSNGHLPSKKGRAIVNSDSATKMSSVESISSARDIPVSSAYTDCYTDAASKYRLIKNKTRLKGPRGIAVNSCGELMVADEKARVVLFDRTGNSLGTLLNEEDCIRYPEALQSDGEALLCLTESCQGQNIAAIKLFHL